METNRTFNSKEKIVFIRSFSHHSRKIADSSGLAQTNLSIGNYISNKVSQRVEKATMIVVKKIIMRYYTHENSVQTFRFLSNTNTSVSLHIVGNIIINIKIQLEFRMRLFGRPLTTRAQILIEINQRLVGTPCKYNMCTHVSLCDV